MEVPANLDIVPSHRSNKVMTPFGDTGQDGQSNYDINRDDIPLTNLPMFLRNMSKPRQMSHERDDEVLMGGTLHTGQSVELKKQSISQE